MTIRRTMPLAAVALCFSLVLLGCGNLLGGEGPVRVRLQNASNVIFEAATLFSADGPHVFLDVAPGEATPYVIVSVAYRAATTEVVIPGDTMRKQVIDFVGEEPLGPGRYTYVLRVFSPSSANPTLGQELRPDN